MMISSIFTTSCIKASKLVSSLLLLVGMVILASCGEEIEPYRDPCSRTDAQKQEQKIIDVDLIGDYFFTNKIDTSNMKKTASGIHYFNLTQGSGDLLKLGDRVEVHYVGKFLDGSTFETSTSFDNSYNRQPLKVVIGGPTQAQAAEGFIGVIEGWNEALQLMRVGEETRFYIPSYLAYGFCPRGSIPSNSVLAFDIKVLRKF